MRTFTKKSVINTALSIICQLPDAVCGDFGCQDACGTGVPTLFSALPFGMKCFLEAPP